MPFKSTKNTLDVEMENTMNREEDNSLCSTNEVTSDKNEKEGYLQWVKISLHGVSSYLKLFIIYIFVLIFTTLILLL